MSNILITEEQYKRLFKQVNIPENKENNLILNQYKIVDKLSYGMSLPYILTEYRSTFLSKDDSFYDPEYWSNKLTIVISNIMQTIHGYDYFTVRYPEDKEKYDLPDIPFMNEYTMHLRWVENQNGYNGTFTFEVDKGKGRKIIPTLKLNLGDNSTSIEDQVYIFVNHEFMHAYQAMKMGEDNFRNKNYRSNYRILDKITTPNDKTSDFDRGIISKHNKVLTVIRMILYHTTQVEADAYLNQAIAEYVKDRQNGIEYTKGTKVEQLNSLLQTKLYEALKHGLSFVEKYPSKLSDDEFNELWDYIKRILKPMMNWGRTAKCGNISWNNFVGWLSKRIDQTYTDYKHKILKWIEEETIKENHKSIFENTDVKYGLDYLNKLKEI